MLTNSEFDKQFYCMKDKGKYRKAYKAGKMSFEDVYAVYNNQMVQLALKAAEEFFTPEVEMNTISLGDCKPCPTAPTPSCPSPIDWRVYEKYSDGSYQEGNNPMNTLNATATVNTKTDLQTQRDYLLSRQDDILHSFQYGQLRCRMTDAFNLNADNSPKTSKELFDGIKSGKYTLDEKKVALQDLYVTGNHPSYDNDDGFIGDREYAINWGGLAPDRLGYEQAREKFSADLKAAKDTIMIGSPEDGLKALQALEAWTTPAGPAN